MATAFNGTISLYKGVPLVKGGTEVLYLAQSSALAQLGSYFYQEVGCSFSREGWTLRVDEPIASLYGCNYVTYTNPSHGNKIFFGFIDQLNYINDQCTEIVYSIDPFPTYLGDTTERSSVYVKRNTPLDYSSRSSYGFYTSDFSVDSVKYTYDEMAARVFGGPGQSTGVAYFGSVNVSGQGTIAGTGLKMGPISAGLIDDIQRNGGTIIGTYVAPSSWVTGAQQITDSLPDIGPLDPFSGMVSTYVGKLYSGQYAKLALVGSSETKYFDIEAFDNPRSISFGVNRLLMPCPSVFIYPKNYRNVAQNLSEGMLIKFPAIPITANAVYTTQQRISEIAQAGAGASAGAVSGAAYGPVGSIIGAEIGALIPLLKGTYQEYIGVRFQPPTIIGHGEPVVDGEFAIRVWLRTVRPNNDTLKHIDQYLMKYGYAYNSVLENVYINKNDKSFLQTGDEFLVGSSADDALNARLMTGVILRTSLN